MTTLLVTFVAFLFLVVRPGAPSSGLAPSSDALVPSSKKELPRTPEHVFQLERSESLGERA